ncbi:hypothetical protein FI667_g14933, partial [Globisporangium splendens]
MQVASAETIGNSDRHPGPSSLASWIERLWTLWDATQLRVSALYQLAFVLETHIEVIQAKLFVWVTYSLTYNLEHSGMDFTSVIDWFRNATT